MYPIYDFACPVVDSLEGVPHALRMMEYKDRDAQYARMLKALGMRPIKVNSLSQLMDFVKTVLSKRKLQWFVEQKIVTGWDDPRFLLLKVLLPFILLVVDVVGIMRRGCEMEALRKFIFSQGPSKNINNLEWASFWAENKKVIDPVAKRFTCINDEKWFHPHFHSGLKYKCPSYTHWRMFPIHLSSRIFLVIKRILTLA
jgi:glutamyl-tRNA synthetase